MENIIYKRVCVCVNRCLYFCCLLFMYIYVYIKILYIKAVQVCTPLNNAKQIEMRRHDVARVMSMQSRVQATKK